MPRLTIKYLVISFSLVSTLSHGAAFDSPSCTEIKKLWNTKFSVELNVEKESVELDATCDGPKARFAYSVEFLHRHTPEMYKFLTGKIKKLAFKDAPILEEDPTLSEEEKKKKQEELNNVLADTESENGKITIYNHLLTEGREYIAAQLAHEAAHLRPTGEDPDHVTCEKGELKGQEGHCGQTFTGELTGDSYNFTFWVLKRFYKLSDTEEEIDKEAVLEGIRDVLENNFNSVPDDVLNNWRSEEPIIDTTAVLKRRKTTPEHFALRTHR